MPKIYTQATEAIVADLFPSLMKLEAVPVIIAKEMTIPIIDLRKFYHELKGHGI